MERLAAPMAIKTVREYPRAIDMRVVEREGRGRVFALCILEDLQEEEVLSERLLRERVAVLSVQISGGRKGDEIK
jgi:hypothetical protein